MTKPAQISSLQNERPIAFREHGGMHFCIDAEAPNWMAITSNGRKLLELMQEPLSRAELVAAYARATGKSAADAEGEVERFTAEIEGAGLLAPRQAPYGGRKNSLALDSLEEFWVQINDFCNLSCAHCLVNSSPSAGKGLDAPVVRKVVEDALDLGARFVAFTGGEPFFREDLFDLWDLVLEDPERTLLTLSNGTLIKGKVLEEIKRRAGKRVELRISLDGPSAEVNDPIRGKGSFKGAIRGIRNAVEAGCRVTVTTSLNGRNFESIHKMPALLRELGVSQMHVLWPFQRGRALEVINADLTPTVTQLIEGYARIQEAARAAGVQFFNYDAWKVRIDGAPGFKYDLANHCWSSLCFNTDGKLYPSPALTQHEELALGKVAERSLRDIWQNSPRAQAIREVSVVDRPQCSGCSLRFICGGGDMDHAYNTSRAQPRAERGDYLADDPYCNLYQRIIDDSMLDLARQATRDMDPAELDTARILRQMGRRPGRKPSELGVGQLPMGTIPST
jgi:radical SAM protein with 4Fe4S-binding SPASM domain